MLDLIKKDLEAVNNYMSRQNLPPHIEEHELCSNTIKDVHYSIWLKAHQVNSVLLQLRKNNKIKFVFQFNGLKDDNFQILRKAIDDPSSFPSHLLSFKSLWVGVITFSAPFFCRKIYMEENERYMRTPKIKVINETSIFIYKCSSIFGEKFVFFRSIYHSVKSKSFSQANKSKGYFSHYITPSPFLPLLKSAIEKVQNVSACKAL